MTKRLQKLSHTLYECKYHLVFCPKYRYRVLEGEIGDFVKNQVYSLSRQRELVNVMEINVQPDHIHTVMSIPPKYSVSEIMGYVKGKISLNMFHRYEKFGKRFWGRHLWSRGYCVSTVGLNEEEIRKYVRWQENQERTAEQ